MTRRAVLPVVATCLLAGPTALAFYSGGFFTEPRLVAGIVAWALVLALAVAGPAPLPRGAAGWLAVGGLALIAVWSAISLAWALNGEMNSPRTLRRSGSAKSFSSTLLVAGRIQLRPPGPRSARIQGRS